MTLEQKIVEIADRLGFEAARLWPQVVAIVWVKSLCYLVMQLAFVPLVWAALLVYWLKFFRPAIGQYRDDLRKAGERRYAVEEPIGWIAGLIVGAVAASFITVLVVSLIPDNIAGVLYPEATTVLRLAGK
jgi:hypothetical protein